ncbi:MAG: coenzyme F420-0:L-glutamate ligase [Bacilli bacterium]|nr:coenzyme F420-0:L-glutamate ligase [Bacilli bacterium]
MKYSGTIVRGVKAPIIRKGDNIVDIVNKSLENIVQHENVGLKDGDIICVTESVVAISQNNYATIDDIGKSVEKHFSNSEVVGLVFPILSRNRFSILLEGIRKGVKKLVVQLSYPADEVGNKLVSEDDLIAANVNPYLDTFTTKEFRKLFKNTVHEFTGVDYIKYYQDIIGEDCDIIFSNDPNAILKYTNDVIVASIHSRKRVKNILLNNGAKKVIGLDEILNEPINGSGYNPDYGLLGSNLATESSVKLFPRDAQSIVLNIQDKLKQTFGVQLEVMIYGDGAFKDPRGGIWELADPVVSPGFTKGLLGTPNELKLKYLANKVNDEEGMKQLIKAKDSNLVGKKESLGTTPRQIVDLLGSLADLTSGSGDKGTPFVLIQNYFSNYATE